MIKMITAFTDEIDEASIAVAQIERHLAGKPLLRSSVGLIHCHEDFLQSGALRAICDALPFDVAGCTSVGSAVPGAAGPYLLTLTVLTSDDVTFAAGASDPVGKIPDGPLERLHERICSALPGKPAMYLVYDPFPQECTSDQVLDKLAALADNAPFFGMRALDDSPDHAGACTIWNGAHLPASVVLVAMSGDVDPVFVLENKTDGRMFKQRAVITDADGNLLRKVNGVSAVEYFNSIGLSRNGRAVGREALLFLVRGRDTPPFCRVCMDTTPDGHVRCGGNMPVGAELQLEIIDAQSVVASARKLVTKAMNMAPGKNMLLASCILRSWALGMDEMAEMKAVAECASRSAPWHLAYSGGEICPVRDAADRWVNTLHNATLAICLL